MINKTIKAILGFTLCLSLTGCGNTSTGGTNTGSTNTGIEEVTVITEVFGDGQKASGAALKYASVIDASSLSPKDFTVDGQTVSEVYTNSEAALTDSNIEGNYVILKFAYENSSDPNASSGGNSRTGNRQNNDDTKDDSTKSSDEDSIKEKENFKTAGSRTQMDTDSQEQEISISVTQTGEVDFSDGTVVSPLETPISSSSRIDLVVEDFDQYEYTDPESGYTIPYNLYLPENYDESKSYPLVFFVADAGTNNDEVTSPLTQGNGATIWATPEEQAKHECIVLAPQYTSTLMESIGDLTEDTHQWNEGLTLVTNLLFNIIDEYSVDENRIYGTGQSQGCMTNIAISDKYPDLFAAQYLVAGQWDTEEMSVLKDHNLWITVCEGDTKAYPGMNEAIANWKSLGASVATSDMWDSTSTPEEFTSLVQYTLDQGANINYTVLESGSHTYTWTVAYNIEGIRDWLFEQSK